MHNGVIPNAARIYLLCLFWISCGGGGPGAPSLTPDARSISEPSTTVPSVSQLTSLSISVPADLLSADRDLIRISLSDRDGNEKASMQTTEGKATLETTFRKSESDFYRITVEREGQPNLETVARVTAGETDKPVAITLATTLAVVYAEAFNVDSLERAKSFYIDVMSSLDQKLVERAFHEFVSIEKGEISVEDAHATREILSDILNRM